MQQNKLNVLINFIRNNSEHKKKFFDRFEIDSRKVNSNQVFLSVEENESKNHKNIKNAIENNASAIITSRFIPRNNFKTIIPFIVFKDLKKHYHKLFLHTLEKHKHDSKIIGITGTNGKTSTVLLLANALANSKMKVGVISSEGIGIYPILKENNYTTPTIDIIYKSYNHFLNHKCDYIIIECSSQGLHQGRLKGIYFDYSLITNIFSDHLDYHKTLKKYINSKLSIINQSKVAILNYDSPILRKTDYSRFKETKIHYISENIKYSDTYFEMDLDYLKEKIKKFHISSILFVNCLMRYEGFKDDDIKKSLSNLSSVKGRRNIIYTENKGTYIIDYAHTAQSYRDIYKDFNKNQSVTTLFGCGGDRDKTKRKITANIVDKHSSSIFITEDNSRTENFTNIVKDILKGINRKSKYIIQKSRKKALTDLFRQSRSNDINFILGKGSESYIIRGKQKIKHNDMNYILDMIKKI
tara:strand:- start:1274 stop:2680 length:1407 start_codon:yes stop_codon:yes gene_type:complete